MKRLEIKGCFSRAAALVSMVVAAAVPGEELAYFDDVQPGMSRRQVLELIGQPDRSAALSEIEYMVYYLPGSGRAVPPECLPKSDDRPRIGFVPPQCLEQPDILLVRIEAGAVVMAVKTLDDFDLEASLQAVMKMRDSHN